MTTAIAAIFVFFLVVMIHELGHFVAAKSVGIKVHEFSIGMGPRLFKIGKGETEYSIRAIPIGGYVKMEGEDEHSDDIRSFNNKPVTARMATIAAGPIMNFILAIIVYGLITLFVGANTTIVADIDKNYPEYKAGLRSGDRIVKVNDKYINSWDEYINNLNKAGDEKFSITVLRENEELKFSIKPATRKFIGITPQMENNKPTTVIAMVDNTLPAYEAGIKSGDKIIKINNQDIKTWEDIKEGINRPRSGIVEITVLRNGEEINFKIKPKEQPIVGFTTEVDKSIGFAIKNGFKRTIFYIGMMFEFFGKLLSGRVASNQIAGPVGVINLVGEAAKLGFIPLLSLAGFISINLGFFNLLPIPALDGSRLLFQIIELFRGKPIDPEKEGFIHFVGFVFLILLMIFVTYKDIIRLNVF
ncbi:RIP metalloprotease RseP [Caldisalinibacter kiritimatiensis]|uniref:Zinc metalloprotease n=1 Tax=Caldisalinibacter kiritimatiensis TaxID=1304284 RepID=R1CVE2_9FIRM|nr:RIP metalloprotease RseP [Caldisalinibacter kiritimatiensis]EOD00614.1 Membrane-associated zinc metalloprotease [Caldisalinibacter kiritimatiensis]